MSRASQAVSRSKIGAVVRVSLGNFLEMYDFMVFGYYAAAIGRAFFPTQNEYASLMLSLMTFGTGYLMRPLGAIVLGAYIDHHGRRKGLLLTLSLMAIGTLSIAVMPGYETIGLFAPLLIVAGRLVQGLSAGVEIGGVSVYLAEIATAGRKGFFVSWQSASQQVAVISAALIGLILSTALRPEQMAGWGWRVPLLIGSMLIPFLLLLRRSLTETDDFKARTHRPNTSEIWRTVMANWRLMILGMMLTTTTTVTFYLITAYMPTYGSSVLHLTGSSSMLVTLLVGISNFCLLPLMGAFSDRVGRRPMLLLFSTIALLTPYPVLMWLVRAPSFTRLLAAALWFSMIFGSYNGSMVVFLTEVMPANVRVCGFSFAYSLATGIFGGFTPAVSTWLIHETGNPAMPGAWMALAGLMSLTATLILTSRGFQRRAHQSSRAVDAVHELPVGQR
ncbi:MAG: citrate-proton symporter [Acidobacteria bacterium]|nr:MAG: citrate-proton symporter [Acidobacteriota bacterium]